MGTPTGDGGKRDRLAALLKRRATPAPFPTSTVQRRMWFVQQLDPGSGAFNLSLCLRLRGELDPGRLGRSWSELVARQGALRTVFRREAEGPVQEVRSPGAAEVELVDLGGLPPEQREDAARSLAGEAAAQPFDLDDGSPLHRTRLIKLGEGDHVLVAVFHHLVADGPSLALLLSQWSTLYEGGTLPPARSSFLEFVEQQRAWLAGDGPAAGLAFWKERLAGCSQLLDLQPDFPRPDAQSITPGAAYLELDRRTVRRLAEVSRELGATPFVTLLAVFELLLSRYTGELDLNVGTPVFGRPRRELFDVCGCFADIVILRTAMEPGLSFRDFLGEVRGTAARAFDHQDIPLSAVVEAVHPRRTRRYNPLIQVLFNLVKLGDSVSFGGCEVSRFLDSAGVVGSMGFDLALWVVEDPTVTGLQIAYSPDLFGTGTIAGMLADYHALLDAVLADPAGKVGQVCPTIRPRRRPVVVGTALDGAPIDEALSFWRGELSLPIAHTLRPLAQVLRDPPTADELLYLVVRDDDLENLDLAGRVGPGERRARNLDAIVALVRSRSAAGGETVVIHCPGQPSPDRGSLGTGLLAALQGIEGVVTVPWEPVARRHPDLEWYAFDVVDQWQLTPTRELHVTLGTLVARSIFLRWQPARKVALVDADDVSDSSDAVLRWRPSAEEVDRGFAEAARARGLGLENLVFVSPSAERCGEARRACPEVLVLQAPTDIADPASYLQGCWALAPEELAADRPGAWWRGPLAPGSTGFRNVEQLLRGLDRLSSPAAIAAAIDARREQASVAVATEQVEPRSPAERQLAALWREVLGREAVGIHDNFFDIGGDSVQAIQIISRAREAGILLQPDQLFEHQTIAELARHVEQAAEDPYLVRLTSGPGTPLFLLPAADGDVLGLSRLARWMTGRDVFAIRAPGLDGHHAPCRSIDDLRDHYLEVIRSHYTTGPYLVGGFCIGGVVAIEVARQLKLEGEEVPLVLLLDSTVGPDRAATPEELASSVKFQILNGIRLLLGVDVSEAVADGDSDWIGRVEEVAFERGGGHLPIERGRIRRYYDVVWASLEAFASYTPRVFDGDLVLLRATDLAQGMERLAPTQVESWQAHTAGRLQVLPVPGDHFTMLADPHVAALADRILEAIAGRP